MPARQMRSGAGIMQKIVATRGALNTLFTDNLRRVGHNIRVVFKAQPFKSEFQILLCHRDELSEQRSND